MAHRVRVRIGPQVARADGAVERASRVQDDELAGHEGLRQRAVARADCGAAEPGRARGARLASRRVAAVPAGMVTAEVIR